MVMTPEGKIKAAIKSILDALPKLYYDMPVPGGWGRSSLDFVGCWHGRFFAIEAKAPGKSMTPRQELAAEKMLGAGAIVFEIDGPDGLAELKSWLDNWARIAPRGEA